MAVCTCRPEWHRVSSCACARRAAEAPCCWGRCSQRCVCASCLACHGPALMPRARSPVGSCVQHAHTGHAGLAGLERCCTQTLLQCCCGRCCARPPRARPHGTLVTRAPGLARPCPASCPAHAHMHGTCRRCPQSITTSTRACACVCVVSGAGTATHGCCPAPTPPSLFTWPLPLLLAAPSCDVCDWWHQVYASRTHTIGSHARSATQHHTLASRRALHPTPAMPHGPNPLRTHTAPASRTTEGAHAVCEAMVTTAAAVRGAGERGSFGAPWR
jgi:hypothetical protein